MTTTYEEAWAENGDAGDAKANPLMVAKKAADAAEKDAYITAYADIDNGQSVNGENLKDVKPKDKSQEDGNIATNKSEKTK